MRIKADTPLVTSVLLLSLMLSASCSIVRFPSGKPTAKQQVLVVSTELTFTEQWTFVETKRSPWPPWGKTKICCPRQDTRTQLVKGSAWAIEYGGEKLLLTAGHVLGFDTDTAPVHEQGIITYRSAKVLFGNLGVEPREVAQLFRPSPNPDRKAEVAIVRAADPIVFEDITVLELAKTHPGLQQSVLVVGYSGTDFPQTEGATVTYVSPDASFFVINVAVAPGTSGGVVMNSAGKAMGVVASTSKGQTTVWCVRDEMLRRAKWSPKDEILTQYIRPPVSHSSHAPSR